MKNSEMKLKKKGIVVLVLIIWEFWCCSCMVPEDAIKCSNISNSSENYRNCNVTNYLGIFPDRSVCTTAMVKFPSTEKDLISIVAEATRSNTKIKAISRFSHSIPKLVCPGGEKGMMIGTKNLNKIVEVDMEARTMTLQSGVTVREMISEAAKKGLALPHTPYWWGVTIGGLLATGAHGSSLWGKGGALHDHVLQLRIVTPASPHHGYATVRTLDVSHEELNAAKVSLGLLGVVSQVTLKLEYIFKRSVRYIIKNDSKLGDEVVRFGHENEFGDIIWYPSEGEAVYRVDGRVSINASGNGTFDFFPFRPKLPSQLIAFRLAEEELEATRYSYGKCIEAKAVINTLKNNAYGLTNDGKTFTGYPVIGYSNNMQSSGTCLSTEDSDSDEEDKEKEKVCPWDSRFNARFYHQTAFSIPLSSAKPFISDIQKLVHLEPHAFCGLDLYNGILIRYIKASSAYLGKPEDSVEFDLTYYRSKDPFAPRLHQDIFEEIEQMGLLKYGGLPHWGKNRDIAFHGVMRKHYDNGSKFLKVKEAYDPNGLFSSEWSDQVLGIKEEEEEEEGVGVSRDGCALEGLCVCSQDTHCAPSKGYFCRAGRVFKEARVCAFEDHKVEQASN